MSDQRIYEILALVGEAFNAGKLSGATLRAVYELKDHIAALQSENAALREAQRWIPVSERLPESYVPVLVHRVHSYCDNDGYGDIRITARTGVINGNVADWMETGGAYTVTHWMPLPSMEGLHDEV